MPGLLGGRYAPLILMASHGLLLGAALALAYVWRSERADADALRAAIEQADARAQEAIKASHAAAASAASYEARLKEQGRAKIKQAKGDTACAVFADGWRLLAEGGDGEAR